MLLFLSFYVCDNMHVCFFTWQKDESPDFDSDISDMKDNESSAPPSPSNHAAQYKLSRPHSSEEKVLQWANQNGQDMSIDSQLTSGTTEPVPDSPSKFTRHRKRIRQPNGHL